VTNKEPDKSEPDAEGVLAKAWHKLEDATGGRAEDPAAGDQQHSNQGDPIRHDSGH
jgi:hypothetical protein